MVENFVRFYRFTNFDIRRIKFLFFIGVVSYFRLFFRGNVFVEKGEIDWGVREVLRFVRVIFI